MSDDNASSECSDIPPGERYQPDSSDEAESSHNSSSLCSSDEEELQFPGESHESKEMPMESSRSKKRTSMGGRAGKRAGKLRKGKTTRPKDSSSSPSLSAHPRLDRKAALQELNPFMDEEEEDIRDEELTGPAEMKEYDAALEAGGGKAISSKLSDDWEDEEYLARLDECGIGDGGVEEICNTSSNGSGLSVPRKVWDSLHEYQRDGVRWLLGLHRQGIGGILGDEMGLGKTVQLCVHFSALSRRYVHTNNSQNTHSIVGDRSRDHRVRKGSGAFLIVCPATVLFHWVGNFTDGHRVYVQWWCIQLVRQVQNLPVLVKLV